VRMTQPMARNATFNSSLSSSIVHNFSNLSRLERFIAFTRSKDPETAVFASLGSE
jgi:hypothetical protein